MCAGLCSGVQNSKLTVQQTVEYHQHMFHVSCVLLNDLFVFLYVRDRLV